MLHLDRRWSIYYILTKLILSTVPFITGITYVSYLKVEIGYLKFQCFNAMLYSFIAESFSEYMRVISVCLCQDIGYSKGKQPFLHSTSCCRMRLPSGRYDRRRCVKTISPSLCQFSFPVSMCHPFINTTQYQFLILVCEYLCLWGRLT